jgi:hypothetical protein
MKGERGREVDRGRENKGEERFIGGRFGTRGRLVDRGTERRIC